MPNFKAPKPEKDYFQKPNFYPADLRFIQFSTGFIRVLHCAKQENGDYT